jgi:hypothetical protein
MTTDTKRQISPNELAFVFKLASVYPDLTVLEKELTELADLRRRVKRGEAAIIAVRQSQNDLMDAVRRLNIARGQA